MNHSKLYVPDPAVWINFFKTKSRRTLLNQKGGNNILSAKSRTTEEPMNVQLVSPVEAADERTTSTIKRLRKRMRPIRRRRRPQKRIKRKSKPTNGRKRKSARQKGRKLLKHKPKKKRSTKLKKDIFSR